MKNQKTVNANLTVAQFCICAAIILISSGVKAQVSIIQNAIDKLKGYKNFSYRSVTKIKEFGDTTTDESSYIFEKSPSDKNYGYLFSTESPNAGMNYPSITVYNGKNLIHINRNDSTYYLKDIKPTELEGTLLSRLKWEKDYAQKHPSKIATAADTNINATNYSRVVINIFDTVVNKEHLYTHFTLFINKTSGMLDSEIIRSKNLGIGDGITNYYGEFRYSNYKFDQDNIDLAAVTIPTGFHLPKQEVSLPPLAPGTIAPEWTLYGTNGKQLSLSQLKGKVVLLDFYFIGCYPCMLSLKPLNNLYEKYKSQNVVIASLTERDSKKAVLAFDKNYHINFPGFTGAADVVKAYHVEGFPTFYFIDKEGKIAATGGYNDDFEKNATSTIDGLLGE